MTTIILLAVVSTVCALALTPAVRALANLLGLVDCPDGSQKMHDRPVPRVGGVAVFGSYLIAFALPFALCPTVIPAGWLPASGLTVLAVAVIFAVGLIDDVIVLSPLQKLAGQLLAAVLAYVGGIQIQVVQAQELDFWIGAPLTIVWLIGCANAFNLIDGLDGLAAGVSLFATATVFVAAVADGNMALAFATAPLAGALLGFLRYNFNPASIFLGDSGSLTLGFLLGCFGVAWGQKSATLLGMTAPMLALALPLVDTALAVARRLLRNRPIFSGDRGHIHHRLLALGMKPRRAVLIMYGICGATAALALLLNALPERMGGAVLFTFWGGAWIGIQHLRYVEFAAARKVLGKVAWIRRMIDQEMRLEQLLADLNRSEDVESARDTITRAADDFGFRVVRMRLAGRLTSSSSGPQPRDVALQIRIDLPQADYVHLERGFDADPSSRAIAAFATILQRSLRSKLEQTVGQAEDSEVASEPVRAAVSASSDNRLAGRWRGARKVLSS